MWFIEVNVERITTTGLYPVNTVAYNSGVAGGRYILNADSFVREKAKINPAAQNPIYAIKDDFLVKLFPREFIGKYSSPYVLRAASEQNHHLQKLLATELSTGNIYPQNVSGEVYPHFIPTAKAAQGIMRHYGKSFSSKDFVTMNKAALLHDVGKAYIPDTILNKNGKLDDWERKIVDKHAHLGYETLRSTGVEAPVLELVKNHHTYSNSNEPMVQILQIADIYSALKEERPYKASMSDKKALDILRGRAQGGEFEKEYVRALAKSLS